MRVVVAMSGGVDSSVAAAMMVEAGHEVIGIMLRLWNQEGQESTNRCCKPGATRGCPVRHPFPRDGRQTAFLSGGSGAFPG